MNSMNNYIQYIVVTIVYMISYCYYNSNSMASTILLFSMQQRLAICLHFMTGLFELRQILSRPLYVVHRKLFLGLTS